MLLIKRSVLRVSKQEEITSLDLSEHGSYWDPEHVQPIYLEK